MARLMVKMKALVAKSDQITLINYQLSDSVPSCFCVFTFPER